MTPDVNVLVAASRSDHPHHLTALAWLNEALESCAQGERLRLLPMVTAGFLRLATHPRVFVEPTPSEAAHAFVGALLPAADMERLPQGAELPLLEPRCQQHQVSCLRPTSLKPWRSQRPRISPTRPRCTPSGLMAMKVRSAANRIGAVLTAVTAERVATAIGGEAPRPLPARA